MTQELFQGNRLVDNLNVAGMEEMPTPAEIKKTLPLSEQGAATVLGGRATLIDILERRDPRLFAIVGPCSIHDPRAALEYSERLRTLAEEVADTLFLVMRVYFEKPRTSSGWKGFINDPNMDDSFRIDEGIARARELLLAFAQTGLPAGSEALDPLSPQYLADLISWYAIGARTTESQTHREMSSGLSTPVGFKNGTDGDLDVALNAMKSAARPHSFLGIDQNGRTSIVRTRGNRHGHLVLRGGGGRPNFDTVSVRLAEIALAKAGLPLNIVIDCSHANSLKDHALQPLVALDCAHQIKEGNRSIVGLMLESNLFSGSQPIPEDPRQLKYGVSITDPCIDWETTAEVIRRARAELRDVLRSRRS
ncbi:MAG: 3-deoxy-7-phosphoheptulonate synthase [Betaproteobacteria bacterium]|nr:3-deoxy-7-phosphoheptulonate synthase [Betaproteobacteria bacterium]